jgi:hypothetical protein
MGFILDRHLFGLRTLSSLCASPLIMLLEPNDYFIVSSFLNDVAGECHCEHACMVLNNQIIASTDAWYFVCDALWLC